MRRGVWGARVSMPLIALQCPPTALEETRQLMVHPQAAWGALVRHQLPIHTRPPNPPARGDRRPKRYNSALSDLEIFITPGFGGGDEKAGISGGWEGWKLRKL